MNAAVALGLVAVIVAGTLGIATLGARKPVDAAQYVLGGRSFGTLFLWLLTRG